MPIHPEDIAQYQAFVIEQVKNVLKSVEYDPETTLWHYTNGKGLIGILETGAIHATQVACLNDSTELRYASKLLRDALTELRQKRIDDLEDEKFLSKVLELTLENPAAPIHAPSRFFVACFSSQQDDLSQWRAYSEPGGENGYSIGFCLRGFNGYPNCAVLKVNYDKELHKKVAASVAETTLRFYRDGLEKKRAVTPEVWLDEFLTEWDQWISRLAPLVKDDCFRAESEFRIAYELTVQEYPQIRMAQKETLLSRYVPLTFPAWTKTRVPTLPIAKLIIGPGRHQAITRVSVMVLLTQMGYANVPVTISERPLQRA
jgi:hypothetical protein